MNRNATHTHDHLLDILERQKPVQDLVNNLLADLTRRVQGLDDKVLDLCRSQLEHVEELHDRFGCIEEELGEHRDMYEVYTEEIGGRQSVLEDRVRDLSLTLGTGMDMVQH